MSNSCWSLLFHAHTHPASLCTLTDATTAAASPTTSVTVNAALRYMSSFFSFHLTRPLLFFPRAVLHGFNVNLCNGYLRLRHIYNPGAIKFNLPITPIFSDPIIRFFTSPTCPTHKHTSNSTLHIYKAFHPIFYTKDSNLVQTIHHI